MNDLLLQAPDAVIDRPISWADYLLEGETITAFEASISPDDGADLTDDGIDEDDDQVTTVKVGGLTFGKVYELRHAIQTNAGRTDTRSLTIRCAHQ